MVLLAKAKKAGKNTAPLYLSLHFFVLLLASAKIEIVLPTRPKFLKHSVSPIFFVAAVL